MNHLAQRTSAQQIGSDSSDKFSVYTERQLHAIKQLDALSPEQRFAMQVVSKVLPFRVNRYVIEQLIDWDNIEQDPMFRLTFPQAEMLDSKDFNRLADMIKADADAASQSALVNDIRSRLNPHPAGQMEANVPSHGDQQLNGVQHKYRETVLFFPSQGQTCHSYCTFCFRWAQFIGDKQLRFASKETQHLHDYLRQHREVSDILFTGGDPMVMKTRHLANYIEALLEPEFDHIQTIRIGTKALTFWPQRFVSDDDASDLLRLFEKVVNSGKHLAIMAHYNHWRELDTAVAKRAIRALRDTGAVIRSQGPLLAHINDDPAVWAQLWKTQAGLGIVPYYMFVERDTGAHNYFEVPLNRAWQVYREAQQQVSGIARTARGPSMSANPGKVEIQGVCEINGEKVFALRFIQGRNPDWVQRPFFARFDENASWLEQLKPAFGEDKFFFE